MCTGDAAQNLAAKAGFDNTIFNVITLCIKVTARVFDQNGTAQDEEKWQLVINDYKRLLVKSLEFLNNLVVQNERRKLMLWVELFDSSSDPVLTQYSDELMGRPSEPAGESSLDDVLGPPAPPISHLDDAQNDQLPPISNEPADRNMKPITLPSIRPPAAASSPYLLYITREGTQIRKQLLEEGKRADPAEIAKECKRRWDELTDAEKEGWQFLYEQLMTKPPSVESGMYGEALAALANNQNQLQAEIERLKQLDSTKYAEILPPFAVSPTAETQPDIKAYISVSGDRDYFNSDLPEPVAATNEDFKMDYDAQKGLTILDQGKSDLLKRLEPDSEHSARSHAHRHASVASSVPPSAVEQDETNVADDISDGAEPVSEDEESDEDDYPNPGDDGRGLLTDVPLILGPAEIEVLPMIIQSGIVPPVPGSQGYGKNEHEATAIRNMHAVRCHLLLAQNNGQNLLRELLIFVAAWDLREEELYFKVMVKIMDAILLNGLMPFAYHAFREAKDIISPAQAVIMKLLTNIFRARQGRHSRTAKGSPQQVETGAYPTSYEARMVKFLFGEFRNHIIPQTCALIFLQGKIRDGTASPEDFPLNLWDMERMYEGIYQYLEFFAILTEHDKWKWMMAQWEITSELVTLLEELDAAIPRSTPKHRAPQLPHLPTAEPTSATMAQFPATPQPIAVERPYDLDGPDLSSNAVQPPMSAPLDSDYVSPPAEDEPSDFEWRNLKKLAVLVLSSLVWKSPTVQAQLGKADKKGIPGRGVRALLKCCQVDDYNPYIKEHAIMALRFALENCEENQNIVRNLTRLPNGKPTTPRPAAASASGEKSTSQAPAANVDVPKEVLDINGWETYVDAKGQVQLKKREGQRKQGGAPAARPSNPSK